jgi:hypothetical protein
VGAITASDDLMLSEAITSDEKREVEDTREVMAI